MDDLSNTGKGTSQGGRTLPSLPTVVGLALALVLAATPVLGAERKPITTVKGDDYRMADAKMAERIWRFTDPTGDQLQLDGTPASAAPKWSDIKSVYVAATRMPGKLLTKIRSDYPKGTSGAAYGDVDVPRGRHQITFVAVEMARKMPANNKGQQVEIGYSDRVSEATPVQNGTDTVTWAGSDGFTLAGLFSNGAYAAAATDVRGRQPGLELEDQDYYDAESGAFGYYVPGKATWYLVLPRDPETKAISVSVRSSTGVGSVIDRLDLPGGGHFIDVKDPAGGFKPKSGPNPLTCRALETFNGESGTIESLALDSNLIRYTAGASGAAGRKLLAEAIEAAGPVSVALTEVGGDAEPALVEGELTVAEAGDAVTLSFEAPDGQWAFALADELELKTPAGESVIDHMTLTGPAGVRVGPGLDGFVAGNPACASVGSEPATDEEVPADETEADASDEEAPDAETAEDGA